MGNNISQKRVIEKCLDVLDIRDYRHPFADHGAKKLLTGKTILLFVEAQLQQLPSLSDIAINLRANQAVRDLTKLDGIHESSLHRKLEKIPLDLIKDLCLRSMEQVSFYHQNEVPFPRLGKLNLVDASEISLPKKAGEWAYVQKDKNSIKVHMSYCLINSQRAYPDKFILSTGAVSDKEGVDYLVVDKDTTYVFDRGYIKYNNFHSWVNEGYFFVARVNSNSKVKVLVERPVPEEASGILRDCVAEITVPKTEETVSVRLVEYQDEQERVYRVVTNRWDLDAQEVAEVYRHRWSIELFFKWIKQHLKTVTFFNHKPDTVWSQIYLAIIAYCLAELIRIQTGTKESVWNVLKRLRHFWFKTWDELLQELHPQKARTSKGRKKKGKPGRPRKHPKKMTAKKIIELFN